MKRDLPKEYQKGFAKFLGCHIDLSKRVFIPRPETEFWASKAIEDLEKIKGKEIIVLDIFSGSGCLGIAVLKKIKKSKVHFSEIDEKAIGQIKINLRINKINKKRYKIFMSDIFEKLPKSSVYDVILANPPYVDAARIGEVQHSVLENEPSLALVGGKKGMKMIKKFLCSAQKYLKSKGLIFLEFDPNQTKEIKKIADKKRYSGISFFKDQFSCWRFARIEK